MATDIEIMKRPAVQAMIKLEKEEEGRRRSISGMPTEADATEIEDSLQAAFDVLEGVASVIQKIAKSGNGSELQFQIGLDDLGALYSLSTLVHSRLEDLQRELGRVDRAAFSLNCIRLEQRRSREESVEGAEAVN